MTHSQHVITTRIQRLCAQRPYSYKNYMDCILYILHTCFIQSLCECCMISKIMQCNVKQKFCDIQDNFKKEGNSKILFKTALMTANKFHPS